MNAEANLLALQQALRTHTYRPGRAICFVTDGPKPREVFAADFRDRVVHHLLVSPERVFEPLSSTIPTPAAPAKAPWPPVTDSMTFLRQGHGQWPAPGLGLKLDVANFLPLRPQGHALRHPDAPRQASRAAVADTHAAVSRSPHPFPDFQARTPCDLRNIVTLLTLGADLHIPPSRRVWRIINPVGQLSRGEHVDKICTVASHQNMLARDNHGGNHEVGIALPLAMLLAETFHHGCAGAIKHHDLELCKHLLRVK